MHLPKAQFLDIVRSAPLVAIDLIVRDRDGRVLLGLRKNEPAKGAWFVPGGRIHKDETIGAAFTRIALAELGLGQTLQEARFVGVFEHFYATNFAQEAGFGTHYIVLAYEMDVATLPATLPLDQHERYQWFEIRTLLDAEQVHPHTKAYFRHHSAGLRHASASA